MSSLNALQLLTKDSLKFISQKKVNENCIMRVLHLMK